MDKLLPKNAGTKPPFVTTDNTFVRVIQCYFDQSVRELMQSLGNCKSREELDIRGDKNSAYEALLNIYCDSVKIPDMPLAECDEISTQKGISQVLKYINYHFKIAHDKWNTSGSHDDYHNFVGNKSYLADYWRFLYDTDDAALSSFATSDLPPDVFYSSIENNNKRKHESKNANNANNKKTRMELDERRTCAIELIAQSLTTLYAKVGSENDISKKSVDEQIIFYQNKLVEALERVDRLNNDIAKDAMLEQVTFYSTKIDNLKSNQN
jgi:hypothetical protein